MTHLTRDEAIKRRQRVRTRKLIADWRRKYTIDPSWPYLATIQQAKRAALRLYRARGLT